MRFKQSFTLVEILIALALVGVLSVIAINTMANRDNSDEYIGKRNKAIMNIEGVVHEAMITNSYEELDSYSSVISEAVLNKLQIRTASGYMVMRDGVYFKITPEVSGDYVATVFLDVNGLNAPNESGQDQYTYYLTRTGYLVEK